MLFWQLSFQLRCVLLLEHMPGWAPRLGSSVQFWYGNIVSMVFSRICPRCRSVSDCFKMTPSLLFFCRYLLNVTFKLLYNRHQRVCAPCHVTKLDLVVWKHARALMGVVGLVSMATCGIRGGLSDETLLFASLRRPRAGWEPTGCSG